MDTSNRLGNTPGKFVRPPSDPYGDGVNAGTRSGMEDLTYNNIMAPQVGTQAWNDRAAARGRQGQMDDQRRASQSSLQSLISSLAYQPGPAAAPYGGGGVADAPHVSMPTIGTGSPSTTAAPAAVQMSPASGQATAPAQASKIADVDTSAAESAIFSRAKDQVGQTSSGALAGLRSALGGRGMLGSGAESRGAANVVNAGQGQLGDVSRQQAITRADLAQRNAEINHSGSITQRGQDMGFATSNADRDSSDRQASFQGGIAQRGQDIGRETAANSLASENARAGYSGAIDQRGQDISVQRSRNDQAMQTYLAQMSQRGDVIKGLMSAIGSY